MAVRDLQSIRETPPYFRECRFFASGPCAAEPRPRAVIRGRHAGVYPGRTKAVESWRFLLHEAAKAYVPPVPTEESVLLSLQFVFARPRGHFCKSGDLRRSAPARHLQRPDLDNLAKLAKDLFTSMGFWRDDSQVTELRARKRWARLGEMPGCHVAMVPDYGID